MKVAIYTLGCKVNQYETQAMEGELRRRGHQLVPLEEAADAYIINTCAVTATSGHKSRQAARQARKRSPEAVVAVCGCCAQTDPEAMAALEVDLVAGTTGRVRFLDDLEALAAKKIMSTGQIEGVQRPPQTPAKSPCTPSKNGQTAQKPVSRKRPLVTAENVMSTESPQKYPDGEESDSLVATGCIMSTKNSQKYPDEKNDEPLVLVEDIMSTTKFEELPAGGLEGRTRALLKVEDGCVNFCAYCVIPYARGPVRSLPLDRAAGSARRLAEEGYKEIVLTGIEISSWGRDLEGGETLADLVRGVCAAAPGCRVRLGSLEPRTVTEESCRALSALPNLCPHFHLSLQSGCDETLKRMNRKYDTGRYYESVSLLRQWFDRPGLTTDLIVGFPGESEGEFAQTLEFLQKCRFSAMHIFPYSRRRGTPAETMPGQVPRAVKEERARRAAQVAEGLRRDYLQSWVGEALPVLFEEEAAPGLWRGHAPNYAEVYAPGAQLHNVEREARIEGVEGKVLRGRLG